jgi:hypothetical protein
MLEPPPPFPVSPPPYDIEARAGLQDVGEDQPDENREGAGEQIVDHDLDAHPPQASRSNAGRSGDQGEKDYGHDDHLQKPDEKIAEEL